MCFQANRRTEILFFLVCFQSLQKDPPGWALVRVLAGPVNWTCVSVSDAFHLKSYRLIAF